MADRKVTPITSSDSMHASNAAVATMKKGEKNKITSITSALGVVSSMMKISPRSTVIGSTGATDTAAQEQEQKLTDTRPLNNSVKARLNAASFGNPSFIKAPRLVCRGHKNSVLALSMIEMNCTAQCTDTLILSGSEDKTLRVWSLTTGNLVVALQGHRHRVAGVVGFCNEQCPPVAVTASWDESLRIWPLDTCFPSSDVVVNADTTAAVSQSNVVTADANEIYKRSVKLTGFKNRVLCITSLLLDDQQPAVAAGSSDSTIQIFRIPDGEKMFILHNKDEATWNLCLTSWQIKESAEDPSQLCGPVVISGCKNSTVRIWRALRGNKSKTANRKPYRVIRNAHDSAVHSVSAFDYHGPMVVTACKELDIKIFSILSGELMKVLTGHKNTIKSIAAHDISARRGGAIITSASANGNVRVWKYSTGEILRFYNGHTECINAVSIFNSPEPHKDDLVIVSGSKDQTVRTWLFAEEKTLKVLRHSKDIYKADPATLSTPMQKTLKSKTVRVSAIAAYSGADQAVPLVVTGADDGHIRVWTAAQTEDDIGQSQKDRVADDVDDDLIWSKAAHRAQILSIVIYAPPDVANVEDLMDKEIDVTSHGLTSQNSLPRIRGNDDTSLSPRSTHDNVELPPIQLRSGRNDASGAKSALLADFDPLLTKEQVRKYMRRILIISSCRDGLIRIGNINNGGTICRFIAHNSVVTSLSIFNGDTGSNEQMSFSVDPFLVSGSEDNSAKVWHLETILAEVVENCLDVETKMIEPQPLKVLNGHEFDVTCVATYIPVEAKKKTKKDRIIAQSQLTPVPNTTTSRDGDQFTSVDGLKKNASFASHLDNLHSFSVADAGSMFYGANHISDPLIITASVDSTVCLWSFSSGECIEVLCDAKEYLSSLCIIPRMGSVEPMIAAGDGAGRVYLWSLTPPYKLLTTLGGHNDEISSLSTINVEGKYPILVSGSLDNTIRIWDLKRLKFKTVIEGHTDDILVVSTFLDGKREPAIASGSADSTVRILFDFMGNIRSADIIRQQFEFDLYGTNMHIRNSSGKGKGLSSDCSTRWPRISAIVNKEGAEYFFALHYELFWEALRAGRSDFLEDFLPLTRLGLVKTNGEFEDNCADDKRGGLLRQAIVLKDLAAVRVIVSCWCTFLSTPPQSESDILYDMKQGRISLADMLLLAKAYPKDFERLICSIKLHPVQGNNIPKGSLYLRTDRDGRIQIENYHSDDLFESAVDVFEKAADGAIDIVQDAAYVAHNVEAAAAAAATAIPRQNESSPLRARPSSLISSFASAAVEDNDSSDDDDDESEHELRDNFVERNREQTFLFLPVDGLVHMEMLKAFTEVCASLDSVEIFNSDCGQLALSYAWNTFGIKAHSLRMLVYLFYVGVTAVSLMTFETYHHKVPILSLVLIIVQLALDFYFMYEEKNQYLAGIIEYCSDIWNFIDLCVILSNVSSNVLRLVLWDDNSASLVLLCINAIFMWFNILYFLRAVEATGPLVSMILKISDDMKYLIFVVLLVLLGFSQAFWLLSQGRSDLAFSTFDASLLNSFSFMLGGYEPDGFNGARMEPFAVFLSAIYMLIVSILLLNLLIALMGDSYGAVKEKGLAQWKLEQCEMITEMQGSMKEKDRTCMAIVYFRKATEEVAEADAEAEDSSAALNAVTEQRLLQVEESLAEVKASIADIKKGQEEVLKISRMLSEMIKYQE